MPEAIGPPLSTRLSKPANRMMSIRKPGSPTFLLTFPIIPRKGSMNCYRGIGSQATSKSSPRKQPKFLPVAAQRHACGLGQMDTARETGDRKETGIRKAVIASRSGGGPVAGQRKCRASYQRAGFAKNTLSRKPIRSPCAPNAEARKRLIDGRLLRTVAGNLSASGLKRQNYLPLVCWYGRRPTASIVPE